MFGFWNEIKPALEAGECAFPSLIGISNLMHFTGPGRLASMHDSGLKNLRSFNRKNRSLDV
jgi:hypothetical protein